MKTTDAPRYEFTPQDLSLAMAMYINHLHPGSIGEGAPIRTSFEILNGQIHATLTVVR